jgi:hypothetical protein
MQNQLTVREGDKSTDERGGEGFEGNLFPKDSFMPFIIFPNRPPQLISVPRTRPLCEG